MKTQAELVELTLTRTDEATTILRGLLECDDFHIDKQYIEVEQALDALYRAVSTIQILQQHRAGLYPTGLTKL